MLIYSLHCQTSVVKEKQELDISNLGLKNFLIIYIKDISYPWRIKEISPKNQSIEECCRSLRILPHCHWSTEIDDPLPVTHSYFINKDLNSVTDKTSLFLAVHIVVKMTHHLLIYKYLNLFLADIQSLYA